MGQTGYGQIGCKHKGGQYKWVENKYHQVIKTNTDLIEYVTKTIVNKEVIKISNTLILLFI